MTPFTLYNLDCRDAIDLYIPNSFVDSVVTDPPYGLGFMGKEWDHGVPSVEFWRHAYAALKPGGYLLAFGGSRTYHRLVCAIEDAGFEIRDTIMWVYGSGFPKSHNGEWGGTALKPAHEPICVARKPVIGTVANNWAMYGTGALNIDGCRVVTNDKLGGGGEKAETSAAFTNDGWRRPWMEDADALERQAAKVRANVLKAEGLGRWPANLIHDGSDEVLQAFPQAPGQLGPVSSTAPSAKTGNVYGSMKREGEASADSGDTGDVGFKMKPGARRLDEGSAARFFYCAKASKRDRDDGMGAFDDQITDVHAQHYSRRMTEVVRADGKPPAVGKNNHPTVKPTDLMAYLCRLVTPPGGVVLDPFMGSGSTGKAAVREGLRFIGCEIDPAYVAIAQARIAAEVRT